MSETGIWMSEAGKMAGEIKIGELKDHTYCHIGQGIAQKKVLYTISV